MKADRFLSEASLVNESLFLILTAVKRFYLKASAAKSKNDYEIHLDKKSLKTPRKQTFRVKNEALANAVAAEWCAQKNVIAPESMHLVSTNLGLK